MHNEGVQQRVAMQASNLGSLRARPVMALTFKDY